MQWVIDLWNYLPGENTKDAYRSSRRNWTSTPKRDSLWATN